MIVWLLFVVSDLREMPVRDRFPQNIIHKRGFILNATFSIVRLSDWHGKQVTICYSYTWRVLRADSKAVIHQRIVICISCAFWLEKLMKNPWLNTSSKIVAPIRIFEIFSQFTISLVNFPIDKYIEEIQSSSSEKSLKWRKWSQFKRTLKKKILFANIDETRNRSNGKGKRTRWSNILIKTSEFR